MEEQYCQSLTTQSLINTVQMVLFCSFSKFTFLRLTLIAYVFEIK